MMYNYRQKEEPRHKILVFTLTRVEAFGTIGRNDFVDQPTF